MTDSFTFLMREQGELPCQSAPQLFFDRDSTERKNESIHTASRYELAKKLCWECPIRKQCLDYALRNEIEYGVWGKTTPKERAKMLKG